MNRRGKRTNQVIFINRRGKRTDQVMATMFAFSWILEGQIMLRNCFKLHSFVHPLSCCPPFFFFYLLVSSILCFLFVHCHMCSSMLCLLCWLLYPSSFCSSLPFSSFHSVLLQHLSTVIGSSSPGSGVSRLVVSKTRSFRGVTLPC